MEVSDSTASNYVLLYNGTSTNYTEKAGIVPKQSYLLRVRAYYAAVSTNYSDVVSVATPGGCGDLVCQADLGETCSTCPTDCGPCGMPTFLFSNILKLIL